MIAAPMTISGSGSFLNFHSNAAVASANTAVIQSVIERVAITTTAPAYAPMAAAVTPSTNATMPGCLPCFLKYGAGSTVRT